MSTISKFVQNPYCVLSERIQISKLNKNINAALLFCSHFFKLDKKNLCALDWSQQKATLKSIHISLSINASNGHLFELLNLQPASGLSFLEP